MRLLPLVIACAAQPALSDCPTRADMELGVKLRDASGETETFRAGPNGFIRGEYADGQGGGANYLLLGGIYVVEVYDTDEGEVVPGTRSTFAYPVKPSEFTPPPRRNTMGRDNLGKRSGRHLRS
ncbi:hypothetical protein [uncultured Shimia sp.]|uniref:hypothetical protein n=1 Tax=uncultured Shimia sp. TaxID=573152 RepID=UPI002610B1CD|nr:hypothetical protein [uncultured Shimia sp.]